MNDNLTLVGAISGYNVYTDKTIDLPFCDVSENFIVVPPDNPLLKIIIPNE